MGVQVILGTLDVTGADEYGVVWSLDALEGWGGTASTIEPIKNVRASGSVAGAAFRQSRHVVLSGQVFAPSQDDLTAAIDRLITAASLSGAVLQVVEGSRTRWLNVRAEDEVLFSYISDKMAAWSVQLIALDPRKFGAPVSGSTSLPATSGGVTVPFTVPVTIASTFVSGQVNLTNPGNTVGPVMLRVNGPAVGPVITHNASGIGLVFSSALVLAAGEYLDIDMEKRTALANGQASRSGYITSRGWFGFDPGNNAFSFTASGFDALSSLTVTASPAWD